MNPDGQLLTEFVERAADGAFTELVRRHVNMVYATALRRSWGDNGLAADVTQQVFIALARHAGRLRREGSVAGWLHQHTLYETSKALRSEQRRRRREHEYAAMNSTEPPNALWAQVAPVLDDALGRLAVQDREALLLRFFEDRDLRTVGSALGIGEDAAQKRVARALEKLRALLARRGAALSAAALAGLISEQGAVAAPATLVTSVCTASLAAAAGGAAGSLLVAKIGMMMTTKAKIILAAVVVAAGIATPLVQHHRLTQREETEMEQAASAQANLAADLQKKLAQLNQEAARLHRQNRALRDALLSAAAVAPKTATKAAGGEGIAAHIFAESDKIASAWLRLNVDLTMAYLKARLHLSDEQARLLRACLNQNADYDAKWLDKQDEKEQAKDGESLVSVRRQAEQSLTPSQKTDFEQFQSDVAHQMWIPGILDDLTSALQISQQQQEQARTVLQTLSDTLGASTGWKQWEKAGKEALRAVLTPAQQQSYEQFLQVQRKISGY